MSRQEILERIHSNPDQMDSRMKGIRALNCAYKSTKILCSDKPLTSDRVFTLLAINKEWKDAQAKMDRVSPSVNYFEQAFLGFLHGDEFHRYQENFQRVNEQVLNVITNPACRELLTDILLTLTQNKVSDTVYKTADLLIGFLGPHYKFGMVDPGLNDLSLAEIWKILEDNSYWNLFKAAQQKQIPGEPS